MAAADDTGQIRQAGGLMLVGEAIWGVGVKRDPPGSSATVAAFSQRGIGVGRLEEWWGREARVGGGHDGGRPGPTGDGGAPN
jgi:hypothetical protein